MTAPTITTGLLSGLDEIDARRHIASAVDRLLHELDHRDDCPCYRPATVDIALDDLYTVAEIDGDRIPDPVLTSLNKALAELIAALDLGCTHECPPLDPADAQTFVGQLIDRLDAAGYRLIRGDVR